jgi:tetratricopeptide (TPR) repeat protein
MNFRLSAALLLGSVATVMSVPAGAQAPEPGAAARTDEARKSFELGLRLYHEGSPREALAAFSHAYRLSPRGTILRNIALCHRDLKDFANAHTAYEELLHRYASELSATETDPRHPPTTIVRTRGRKPGLVARTS